jgi:hypothetical protein
MKVSELITMLQKSSPDDQVVIGLADGYMGQQPYVDIRHIYNGFDWEDGYTYIIGKQKLFLNASSLSKE